MKKITLATLILFLNFTSPVKAQTQISAESKNLSSSTFSLIINSKYYKLTDFNGEYNLLGQTVTISAKTNNILQLTFPDFQYSEGFNDYYKNMLPEFTSLEKRDPLSMSYLRSIFFPFFKRYEITPIGGTTFVLKNSGGFSVEFLQERDGFEKELILRNPNGEIFTNAEFEETISGEAIQKLLNIEKKAVLKLNEIGQLKANMHSVQILVETYAVDWGGLYSENTSEIFKEATSKKYWKEFKNPYTGKTGLGKDGAFIDYKTYINYKAHPDFKGLVIYDPLNCKLYVGEKRNQCTSYKIYGTDQNGNLIQAKGQTFYLTNQ